MEDNDGWKSDELLIKNKDKIDNDDSEWLGPNNPGHLKKQRKPAVWFIIFLPWVLLALLGSWNLSQYQKRNQNLVFDPTQQVYSAFIPGPPLFYILS